MREASAYRSAVSNLIVSDMPDRFRQQRMIRCELLFIHDIAPTRACAEQNSGFIDRYPIQSFEITQVYQERRLGQSKGHRGQQALPSGDYLGLTATGGEQLHDFGWSRWGQVFKIR